MKINRPQYVDWLLRHRGNGQVKVVTGLRRCGKSFLLFTLFRERLVSEGVPADHIVGLSLDDDENRALRNPIRLGEWLRARIADSAPYTFLLDEIQFCRKVRNPDIDPKDVAPDDRDALFVTFHDILNGLIRRPNVDVYVTGSNSKMLSSDVATEFRGRGDVLEMHPLSFAEFCSVRGDPPSAAFDEYLAYGGLPLAVLAASPAEKQSYLAGLFRSVYLADIVERHKLQDDFLLGNLVNLLASAVGSLTNPSRIVDSMRSVLKVETNVPTVQRNLGYLEEAFLFRKALRYDIRGHQYLDYPMKWYAEDVGVRNAVLSFRQQEPTYLMENAVYNELRRRGWQIDVGVVDVTDTADGVQTKRRREIDFVVNRGSDRVYVQSAFRMDTPDKREQETKSLLHSGDFFRKVVVTGGSAAPWSDENGVVTVGVIPFLLDPAAVPGL